MSLDEWPGVFGFPAGDGGPKTKDLFQMTRPVVDLPEEDGSNDLMLPHVRIEVLQQGAKRLVAADALKKGRSGWRRHGWGRPRQVGAGARWKGIRS